MTALTVQPNITAKKAATAISKGQALKYGVDFDHVTPCTANTDKCIGFAWDNAAEAEDLVEVATFGGGAKVLLADTVTRGKYIVPSSDGKGEQTNASGNFICAIALESGVVGDIIEAFVMSGVATAADQ